MGVLASRPGTHGVIQDADGKAPYEATARHGQGYACAVVTLKTASLPSSNLQQHFTITSIPHANLATSA